MRNAIQWAIAITVVVILVLIINFGQNVNRQPPAPRVTTSDLPGASVAVAPVTDPEWAAPHQPGKIAIVFGQEVRRIYDRDEGNVCYVTQSYTGRSNPLDCLPLRNWPRK